MSRQTPFLLSGETPMLPPRFEEALERVRDLLADAAADGIPEPTTLAALLIEILPRLSALYGSAGVASILIDLADNVMKDRPSTAKRQ